jgi:DNA-binding transcriptional LysR family regulator
VLISPRGDTQGVVDEALAARHRTRKVVCTTASFLTPASIVACSDAVVTVPSRIAAVYEATHGVCSLPMPLRVPGIAIVQAWHERTHRDPVHKYFRALVASIIAPTP